MALTSVSLFAKMAWSLSKSNTGFSSTTTGDQLSFNLGTVSVSTFNQLYAAEFVIAASASQTIDLTSLTNLVGESFSFAHALALIITTTGGPITLSPGASNGLVWFFGGTTPTLTIDTGGMFCYSEPAAGPGAVVDSTHKTLKLANNGGTNSTCDIALLGSTT